MPNMPIKGWAKGTRVEQKQQEVDPLLFNPIIAPTVHYFTVHYFTVLSLGDLIDPDRLINLYHDRTNF